MKLDKFTTAYLTAALWSSLTDDGTPMDDAGFTIADIDPDTLTKAIADCEAFQLDNAEDIGTDHERAGRDFWRTRNGHGAGFWDGDWPEAGDRLTTACNRYGEVSLYIGDDGMIHGF